MNHDQLLVQLAADLNMTDLSFDNNRACGLAYGPHLQIDLHADDKNEVLHLTGLIGQVEPVAKDHLMRRLLAANTAPETLGEGRFAFDGQKQEALLCRSFHAEELAQLRLSTEVTRLADACRHWQDKLVAEQLISLTEL